MKREKRIGYEMEIQGLIQGVGFRPFVYRMARKHGIVGWVKNTNAAVLVRATAPEDDLQRFLTAIKTAAPPAAEIERVLVRETEPGQEQDFFIAPSDDLSDEITRVSPDIAVCPDCLQDMKTQERRLDYPFLNCTHCGPRFTIVKDLPYDRQRTTMEPFRMCHECLKEYGDVSDRRFHAQPTACKVCGPKYSLLCEGKIIEDPAEILDAVVDIIEGGGVLAMKGLGGFHLACNALNTEAVDRLRGMKRREAKPFAVMFRDLETLKTYVDVSTAGEEILNSWRRPILIAPSRKELAPGVSNGFGTTGAMLPYLPFHYLLFEKLKTPVVVLTSGNLAEEPIIIDNHEARRILGPLTGGVVDYNREIRNRTDDSVLREINGIPRIIRRSRGYVPNPVETGLNTEGIFAAGAELVNCFALGKGRQAIPGQHIGDLKNPETYDFYRESAERFMRLFRLEPGLMACDLHPDYLSTVYARESGLPCLGVQHHHAHLASVMAEHRLREACLGICYDGTGYGTDGHTWGGEFLVGDLAGFERAAHFRYVPMPGGDLVTREPWRMALAFLLDAMGDEALSLPLPWLEEAGTEKIRLLTEGIHKGFLSPLTSSAGRLFDAVSALTGICTNSGFHAEAPMRLEDTAVEAKGPSYSWSGTEEIDFREMFREMVVDLRMGKPAKLIASRFHKTMIGMTVEVAERLLEKYGQMPVALSGGTWQNRILLEGVENELRKRGFRVVSNLQVPVNDGGIALGQLAVAAAGREAGMI